MIGHYSYPRVVSRSSGSAETTRRAPSGAPPEPLDALGIGVAVRDIAVHLETFPTPDEKYRARGLYEAGGGPAPTALVTLARLGDRVAFCGVVGENPVGRFIVESLERERVDVSGVVFRSGFPSPSSVILVENGRRTILEYWQTDLPLSFEELEARNVGFDRCRFLLIDARLPQIQIEAARRVRTAGGLVVLDCGHPRPGVEEILALTDIAILSHTYPEAALGGDYDAARFLADLSSRLPPDGPRISGLTMGAAGCALFSPACAFLRIPGHKVDALDTTGAGDVFHGAFVHAYLHGATPETAARFANSAAALKCRGMTGRSPLPSEEEIWRIAKSLGEKSQ